RSRTESPAADGDLNFDMNNKSTTQPRETMQLDDETQPQENGEHNGHHSQSDNQDDDLNAIAELQEKPVGKLERHIF
ncbi:hypothetical protein MKW98_021796, partial [Papaver atlanticum]